LLRGAPTLIVGSCSVQAKRGGEVVGPNPTDRGKRSTKYHPAVTGDGVPIAGAATAANVNDTLLFDRLFLTAFAVVPRTRTVFADKGYDAGANYGLCRAFGAEPRLQQRGRPHGSGWGKRSWPAERSKPGCSRTSAWRCATTARAPSPNPCSGSLSLPGCRTPHQGVVTTASKQQPATNLRISRRSTANGGHPTGRPERRETMAQPPGAEPRW
jgi:hypothetical protein